MQSQPDFVNMYSNEGCSYYNISLSEVMFIHLLRQTILGFGCNLNHCLSFKSEALEKSI